MRFRLGEAPGGRQSPLEVAKIRKLTKPHFPGHHGLYLIAPTSRPSFFLFFSVFERRALSGFNPDRKMDVTGVSEMPVLV